MDGKVRAAVMTGPGRLEIQEFRVPYIGPNEAFLRIDACGVGASEPARYRRGNIGPTILGHQIVGTLETIGDAAAARWGLQKGARVVLEEFVPCRECAWCAKGEYRLCDAAEFGRPDAVRFGHTPISKPPSLWGGFAEYVYLPGNAVVHKIPDSISAQLATFATPLANGVQWTIVEGLAAPGKTVLIMGPGQNGLACVVAAKEAGAAKIILCGLTADDARLKAGLALGADAIVDIEKEEIKPRIDYETDERGADVVVDCTGDTSGQVALAAVATSAKGAILVLNGVGMIGIPMAEMKRKYLGLRPVRGHSTHSMERALHLLERDREKLQKLCTNSFGLDEVDSAIRATKGEGFPGAIHVSVAPHGK